MQPQTIVKATYFEKKDKVESYQAAEIEIKTYNENRKKTIKDFNILKAETTDKFMKMINSIFIKYSNDKSISMIFDKKNMIIGKSELDITDEIIKIVNNEIKEFKIK